MNLPLREVQFERNKIIIPKEKKIGRVLILQINNDTVLSLMGRNWYMQVLDENRKYGMMRLYVDNDDDLWHLYNLIRPGDSIRGLTYRRDECQQDVLRGQKIEKKPMTLTLEVEKCGFSDFSSRLRVLGIITHGPQDHGCHHTINIEKGYRIRIFKKLWRKHDLERVRRAVENAKKPTVIFLSIEDDNAVIALVRQSGLEIVADIGGSISGKFYKQKTRGKKEFYSEISEKLGMIAQDDTPIVIVGPGFAKEEFTKFVSRINPELLKHSYLKSTGQAGVTGINEALKEGIKHLYVKEAGIMIETQEVDEVLTEISRKGNVTYGERHVKRALELCAVEKILITDSMIRDGNGEELLALAENTGAKVSIVSPAHEGGKRLEALGGVAALLRYRIEEA